MHASDMFSPCSSSFLINIPRLLVCFIHDCHIFMSPLVCFAGQVSTKKFRGAGIHLRQPSLLDEMFLTANYYPKTNHST